MVDESAGMDQLGEVVAALESRGIECWVDAGSLLGLARDGTLLPWDRDIDVSCWVRDRAVALDAVREIDQHHYRIREARYRGELFKIEMLPPLMSDNVKVDLSFYWPARGRAYTPMVCNMPLRLRRGSLKWWLAQLVRQPMFRLVWPPLRRSRPLCFGPIRIGVFMWAVPVAHFDHIVRMETARGDLPVPADWDGYLAYRYGDWQTPRSNWKAPLDDGAALLRPAAEVLPGPFSRH
jgi:hypothetical protein